MSLAQSRDAERERDLDRLRLLEREREPERDRLAGEYVGDPLALRGE